VLPAVISLDCKKAKNTRVSPTPRNAHIPLKPCRSSESGHRRIQHCNLEAAATHPI